MSSWSPLSALDLVKHLVDGWMDEYRGEGKLSLVQSKSVQMTALWRSDAVFQLYYGYGNSDLHLEATEVNILYFLCVCPGLRCVTLGPAPPGCLQPRHVTTLCLVPEMVLGIEETLNEFLANQVRPHIVPDKHLHLLVCMWDTVSDDPMNLPLTKPILQEIQTKMVRRYLFSESHSVMSDSL